MRFQQQLQAIQWRELIAASNLSLLEAKVWTVVRVRDSANVRLRVRVRISIRVSVA